MVSILFTDFKRFTQASEKLSAKELIEELNVCFKTFDYICERHGIEKIKTIGDAYMAAVGGANTIKDSINKTRCWWH
ncbi:adenylate/guanylate cyclase domain-containing protein [Patiriisocius sp. Uisw_017]|jgi:class 3 adenylate cyclase|uniref:adenylate/guanylate cyclase domain-containing protein n=1 Tax=Patiriisocius sp. Uisw_017 TaxID=3230968 RepID=UPI0039ECFB35